MQDRQLYEQILGSPIPLACRGSEAVAGPQRGQGVSGTCWRSPVVLPRVWLGMPCSLITRGLRTWRHLDTCQLQTILIASVPRVRCPEHGVRIVQIPWAESYGRFTLLLFVVDGAVLAAGRQPERGRGTFGTELG